MQTIMLRFYKKNPYGIKMLKCQDFNAGHSQDEDILNEYFWDYTFIQNVLYVLWKSQRVFFCHFCSRQDRRS